MRTRKNISPQFSQNLDRFTQFLTLVGLTSLIIGGVGVANAIRAYVERERATIATLKSLGATGLHGRSRLMLTQVHADGLPRRRDRRLDRRRSALSRGLEPSARCFRFRSPRRSIPARSRQGALYGFLTALDFFNRAARARP